MTIFLNQCLMEEAKSITRKTERRKVLSSILGAAQRNAAQPRYVGRSCCPRGGARLVGLDWIGLGRVSHRLGPRAESELEPTGIFRGPFPFRALLYAPVCFTAKRVKKRKINKMVNSRISR